MTDREKVIKGLECCILRDPDNHARCSQCPYESNCVNRLKMDALQLLKEQEPVKPKSKVRHGTYGQIQHFCGNCNAMLHGKRKYCSECGKEVKWG